MVRISDATWKLMEQFAQPFETPSALIARAVESLAVAKGVEPIVSPQGLAPRARLKSIRSAARNGHLPQSYFRTPLLRTLYELGGTANLNTVKRIMEGELNPVLGTEDRLPLGTGDPRWWKYTQFNRFELKNEGLLREDSEKGVWELTADGMKIAHQLASDSQEKRRALAP